MDLSSERDTISLLLNRAAAQVDLPDCEAPTSTTRLGLGNPLSLELSKSSGLSVTAAALARRRRASNRCTVANRNGIPRTTDGPVPEQAIEGARDSSVLAEVWLC